MEYTIWMEGWLATGMEGCPDPASCLGTVEAASFKEACYKIVVQQNGLCRKLISLYDAEKHTVWGCRLFDNEADARKSFG